MDAVEELFLARLITFLTGKGLLPPKRARMVKKWEHSGFYFHRIQPGERKHLERVARYIILSATPFRPRAEPKARQAARRSATERSGVATCSSIRPMP
jgi:hypothetical protein